MNAALLRMARRHRGVRYWTVPGFPNGAKLIPSVLSQNGWGVAFHWPARDDKGDHIRGLDLSRHRAQARQAARDLLGG